MGDRTTTLRLRSIRFKSGGEIRMLHQPADLEVADTFRRSAAAISGGDVADRMAGWAIVAWSRDGLVAIDYRNGDRSQVPSGDVPRYVGEMLRLETAVRWSRDD